MDKLQDLWQFVLTVAAAGTGWFLHTLWDKQTETAKDLHELELDVAKHYVTNERMNELTKAIFERFDNFDDKLDTLFSPTERRRPGHD